MVEHNSSIDSIFQALSHGVRRDMLQRLTQGEMTIGQLAGPLAMSLAAASKHVQILEAAGLVERTVEGRRHVCRLASLPLESAFNWLRSYERFWTGNQVDGRRAPSAVEDWREETD